VLQPIFEAMEQIYTGDARGNPFAWLSEIECPVRIATAEKSWPVYKEMTARAAALMPAASRHSFGGVGHCVAQENPKLLLQALKAFESQAR
jgi:pimeloyl-ACP methyl ester carboxylesterase